MDDKTPPPTPAATNFEPRTGKYLTVTATEFQTRAGAYIERSGKAPVVITKHSRPARVLVDFDEYERLKSHDTRRALYPRELGPEARDALDLGYQGEATPELDHLLD